MNWAINNWDQLWQLIVQHTALAVAPTFVGLALAIPLGLLLYRTRTPRRIAVVLSSVVFTIPSLALFVVIPSLIGTQILDPLNVVIALSLYSTALLVRSALEALDSVDPAVRAAAEAIGTSRARQALLNDLPLSIPVLTAGARVVAVTNVSLVSVGAVIGIGGLGQLFTTGYQRDYPDQILAGILAILALAFVVDRAIALAGRALTPWTRDATPRRRPRRREVVSGFGSNTASYEPKSLTTAGEGVGDVR